MSRYFTGILAILLTILAAPVRADDADEFLLRPVPGALERVLNRYRLRVLKTFPAQNLYLVQPEDDDNFEDHARGDRDIAGLEKNQDVFAPEIPSGSTSPNEDVLRQTLTSRRMVNFFGSTVWEGFVRQPAATLVGLPEAQSRLRTGAGVVAVIDTGVDPGHPVLRNALVPGFDFTRDTPGFPSDLHDVDGATAAALTQTTTAFIDNSARPVPLNQYAVAALTQTTTAFIDTGKLPNGFGHGTMVASLVRLAAPTARIMPLKAFLADGRSNTFDILRAIYFAADNGANIVNMSFNFKESSPELVRALNYASNRRVTLVSSAGNDGNEIIVYPAAYANVIGVASTNVADERSGFTNYGAALVTVSAPGEGVIAAYPGNNYASVWGTSFSTPLVAGAAAVLLQKNPQMTPRQIESALVQSAKPLEESLGAGRLTVGRW